jgi:hyperosmotically inducible periplasmic protein
MKLKSTLFILVLTALGATAPTVPLAQERSGSVVVEERRAASDELILGQVMDRLASNSRLEGKIGVETRDAVVTLTGWTRTEGQAWIAEQEARSVAGVAYVHNRIRPRMSA